LCIGQDMGLKSRPYLVRSYKHFHCASKWCIGPEVAKEDNQFLGILFMVKIAETDTAQAAWREYYAAWEVAVVSHFVQNR